MENIKLILQTESIKMLFFFLYFVAQCCSLCTYLRHWCLPRRHGTYKGLWCGNCVQTLEWCLKCVQASWHEGEACAKCYFEQHLQGCV